MQFRLTSAVAALLFLRTTTAVRFDFEDGSSTSCGGPIVFTVFNAAKDTCYIKAGPAASAITVQNVPSAAKAQAYHGSSCSDYASEVGSGTAPACLPAGSQQKVGAANWFSTAPKLARRTPKAEPRFSITYKQRDGSFREAEVPSGHAARALRLVERKDYNALAKFPTVSLHFILWVLHTQVPT